MKPSLLLPDGKTCGVDEAGRGPLAGPVFAAAVILDPQKPIAGLNDSKKLSARRRETLAEEIRTNALAWAIASATVEEIDEINILQASLLAMKCAVVQLNPQPSLAEVDGNRCPVLDISARAIIKGDSTHAHIAAASILAKTARDALMLEMARQYPNYGFEKHMGYGTALHLHMLKTHGPCPIHRRSFAPVATLLGLPA